MTRLNPGVTAAIAAAAAVVFASGFLVARNTSAPSQPPAGQSGRKILYWYDPMIPMERHSGPGKSSMNMTLIPKYADAPQTADAGVRVDPAQIQNLGVRLAKVERGGLASSVSASGVIAFNARDVAVVQARAPGFVQRVYNRAPGDIVAAGAPLADLLVPEWVGAQGEFLAVRRTGDRALANAARQRLLLLGMPSELVASVERTGRIRSIVTITTPTGGVIKSLGVRNGMSVTAGETLAEVNGLSRVWLEAAVPEALAGQLNMGQAATAILAAYPGETFQGRITAILPQAQTESRTLTARVELPNPRGRLRPGMFAKVQFEGPIQSALLVPSEAVIRTGRRTLVMLARPGGRYAPAEVKVGRETNGRTEVLAGLSVGEMVVASGQFLLDSEASLSGVEARPVAAASPAIASPAAALLHEGVGRVEEIKPDSVTLSHGPITSVPWPAMTMTFKLSSPTLARGVKVGDRVAFAFDHPDTSPTVRRLAPAAAR